MSPHKMFLPILVAAVPMAMGPWIAPAEADPIPYPDAFIGIWENTSVTRDCVTQVILAQSTEQDTICAGDTFDPDIEGQFPITCTGTITETTVDIHCTGTFEVTPECTATIQFDTDGTRNGDTWTSTTTVEITYVGCPIPGSCTTTQSTGTRVDPDPAACPPAPVASSTWGKIKQRYE